MCHVQFCLGTVSEGSSNFFVQFVPVTEKTSFSLTVQGIREFCFLEYMGLYAKRGNKC